MSNPQMTCQCGKAGCINCKPDLRYRANVLTANILLEMDFSPGMSDRIFRLVEAELKEVANVKN